jgi:hypothetical protein
MLRLIVALVLASLLLQLLLIALAVIAALLFGVGRLALRHIGLVVSIGVALWIAHSLAGSGHHGIWVPALALLGGALAGVYAWLFYLLRASEAD